MSRCAPALWSQRSSRLAQGTSRTASSETRVLKRLLCKPPDKGRRGGESSATAQNGSRHVLAAGRLLELSKALCASELFLRDAIWASPCQRRELRLGHFSPCKEAAPNSPYVVVHCCNMLARINVHDRLNWSCTAPWRVPKHSTPPIRRSRSRGTAAVQPRKVSSARTQAQMLVRSSGGPAS